MTSFWFTSDLPPFYETKQKNQIHALQPEIKWEYIIEDEAK